MQSSVPTVVKNVPNEYNTDIETSVECLFYLPTCRFTLYIKLCTKTM